MNESKDLSGIMTLTHELPTIKRLVIDDAVEDPHGLWRICGFLAVSALSLLTFI